MTEQAAGQAAPGPDRRMLTAYLAALRDRFDWPDLDQSSYSALRTVAVPVTAGAAG